MAPPAEKNPKWMTALMEASKIRSTSIQTCSKYRHDEELAAASAGSSKNNTVDMAILRQLLVKLAKSSSLQDLEFRSSKGASPVTSWPVVSDNSGASAPVKFDPLVETLCRGEMDLPALLIREAAGLVLQEKSCSALLPSQPAIPWKNNQVELTQPSNPQPTDMKIDARPSSGGQTFRAAQGATQWEKNQVEQLSQANSQAKEVKQSAWSATGGQDSPADSCPSSRGGVEGSSSNRATPCHSPQGAARPAGIEQRPAVDAGKCSLYAGPSKILSQVGGATVQPDVALPAPKFSSAPVFRSLSQDNDLTQFASRGTPPTGEPLTDVPAGVEAKGAPAASSSLVPMTDNQLALVSSEFPAISDWDWSTFEFSPRHLGGTQLDGGSSSPQQLSTGIITEDIAIVPGVIAAPNPASTSADMELPGKECLPSGEECYWSIGGVLDSKTGPPLLDSSPVSLKFGKAPGWDSEKVVNEEAVAWQTPQPMAWSPPEVSDGMSSLSVKTERCVKTQSEASRDGPLVLDFAASAAQSDDMASSKRPARRIHRSKAFLANQAKRAALQQKNKQTTLCHAAALECARSPSLSDNPPNLLWSQKSLPVELTGCVQDGSTKSSCTSGSSPARREDIAGALGGHEEGGSFAPIEPKRANGRTLSWPTFKRLKYDMGATGATAEQTGNDGAAVLPFSEARPVEYWKQVLTELDLSSHQSTNTALLC